MRLKYKDNTYNADDSDLTYPTLNSKISRENFTLRTKYVRTKSYR